MEETLERLPIQAEQPIDKGEKLYNNLVQAGFTETNLGKKQQFLEAIKNPLTANKIYSGLRDAGLSEVNLGSLKEFQDSFAQKKNPISNASPNISNLSTLGSNPFQSSNNGMIPVKLVKPAPTPIQTFTQTNGSVRKDKSWENLGDFIPNTVLGGLQKDVGQAVQFLGSNLSKGTTPLLNKDMGDAVARFGARLEGSGQEKQQKAAQLGLPETVGGNVASTATRFAPDLIELALTPELDIAKLGKLSTVLGKYGTKAAQVATGKFPTLMATKGLTSGYVEAKDAGKDDYEATKAGLIKSAEEYGKGALFEGAGKIASKASDIGKKALEDAGWMADGKIVSGAQKAILNSSAQATAFSAVPFITNALEGKATTLKEMKDNAIFGGILGLFHGSGAKEGDHTAADGSAAQVLERSPLIDLHNFANADIDAIKEVHNMPENAADLKIKSAVSAQKAFEAETPEEKQANVVQSSTDGKAASVKAVTDAVLKDKQAVIDAIPDDLESKPELVAKINEVHKELDPTEAIKTDMGKQITDIDTQLQAIPEKSDNPVEQVENEVKAETLTKQKDELTKQLKQTILKQQKNESTNEKNGEESSSQNGSEESSTKSKDNDEENGQEGLLNPTGEGETSPVTKTKVPQPAFKDIRENASTPEDLAKEANAKTWYHGSNKDLSKETVNSGSFSKPDGLLGLGFYMTDNPDVAESYANLRRNKSGSTVNEFNVKTSKLLDAEKPIDNDVSDLYKKTFQSLFADKAESDEFFDDVKKENPKATLMDYHKAIYNHIADEHIPTSEVHENFQDLEAALKDDLGYDAISHVGGVQNKGVKHNVMIVLDPSGEYSDPRKTFTKSGLYQPKYEETKGEQENATNQEQVTKSGEQEHKGTVEQQQEIEENRNNKEEPIAKSETETSGSNSGIGAEKSEKSIVEPTGIRNEDVHDEHIKEGVGDTERTHKTEEEIESGAKKLLESEDFHPDEFAKSIIDKPKAATAEEQEALLHYKTDLKKQKRSIEKMVDNGEGDIVEHEINLARISDHIHRNQEATEIIGNELGRSLGHRTEAMKEDFSHTSILRKAKIANGGIDVDAKTKASLNEHAKKIELLENKLADKEEEIRKTHERSLVDRVNTKSGLEERKAKREVTKSSLRKEREELLADLHIIAKKSLGTLGANKIPLDMIAPLTKLARNYVLDGVVTLSGVVDKVYNDLKEHIEGLTKDEIKSVIQDEFEKYLSEENKIKLDKAKDRQNKKLSDLQEQLSTGNYEKKVQRKVQVDNDYLKIRAEINRQQTLINKKIAQIAQSKKSVGRRAVDFAVKWGRNAKLASITVLGKLAATGLTTMGLKGVTEGVGVIAGKLLPKTAQKSTIEGGASISALANSYAKAATEGMKDAYNEMNIKKGGQSDLSALYGKNSAGRLPAEAMDFFGHLHSAIKAPIKRQAFEYSYAKRIKRGIEQGLDVQDPIIDAKNRLDAYRDGERAIFMGDNVVSDVYQAGIRMLENHETKTGLSLAKNSAALAQILLPFVKVPTNIAFSTGRHVFGLPIGLTKLLGAGIGSGLKKIGGEKISENLQKRMFVAKQLGNVMAKSMQELTPEESDIVLRNLKHGSVGAAALAIGFFNPKNVGGFYQQNEKRKTSDANVMSFKIDGHKVPIWLTEHPIFQAMQIGSTFYRFLEAHKHKEDKISAAALATVSGMAEGIPLANEAKQITDMLGSDTHKLNKFISQAIKGEIEPAALQQAAIVTDTKNGEAFSLNGDNQQKRRPDERHGLLKYLKQDLQTGVPILRKKVHKK